MKKSNMKKLIIAGIIGVIAALIVLTCFTSVPAGYTGVPVTFGKVADYTFDSGFHFKSPFTNVETNICSLYTPNK